MKLVKYLTAIILFFATFYSINFTHVANAAKIKSSEEWNETPLKHYRDLDIGFNTTANDIIIFVKEQKNENLNFKLSVDTDIYHLKPLKMSKIDFKKNSHSKVNLQVIKQSKKGQQTFILKNMGVYRRITNPKKRYIYLLRLNIPIKKLNTDLDKSTIMNLQVDPKVGQQPQVTTVGLSTKPIVGIIVSLFSFIFLKIFIMKNKKVGNN